MIFLERSLPSISTQENHGLVLDSAGNTSGSSTSLLHGEEPLSQRNLSSSTHKYDSYLLSKIGKANNTKTDGIFDKECFECWSQQPSMRMPNVNDTEAPPPLPPPPNIDYLSEVHGLAWEVQDRGEDSILLRTLAPIEHRSSLFNSYMAPRSGGYGNQLYDGASTSPTGSVMDHQSHPANGVYHHYKNNPATDHHITYSSTAVSLPELQDVYFDDEQSSRLIEFSLILAHETISCLHDPMYALTRKHEYPQYGRRPISPKFTERDELLAL